MTNIGNALRYYRKLSKLTQAQVADLAGINEKYYGELERNESSPTIEKLESISYSLGVNIQQLVGYTPLKEIVLGLQEYRDYDKKSIHAYCNCCGTEFFSDTDIICPQCGCEYYEENEFIEVY